MVPWSGVPSAYSKVLPKAIPLVEMTAESSGKY
jgi:hypothetical protein